MVIIKRLHTSCKLRHAFIHSKEILRLKKFKKNMIQLVGCHYSHLELKD
jgi:hypothetical protein